MLITFTSEESHVLFPPYRLSNWTSCREHPTMGGPPA